MYTMELCTTREPAMSSIPLNVFSTSCSASWRVMEGSSTTAVTDVVGSPFPSPSLSELYNTVTCEGVVGDTVLRNCKVRKEGRSLLLNFRRCYRTFPSHIPLCTVYNRRHMKSARSHSHPTHSCMHPHPHKHRHRNVPSCFLPQTSWAVPLQLQHETPTPLGYC